MSRILITIPRRPVITGVFDSENRVGGGMVEESKYILLFCLNKNNVM